MELQVVFENFPNTSKGVTLWAAKISECAQWLELDGLICFKFVSDDEMLAQNQAYLKHDTLTDILTFDLRDTPAAEINVLISVDRVADNAQKFKVSFEIELFRVMSHGLLHASGLSDKSNEEQAIMRKREDELINMFHVEQ
ncbi:MAG: rRNA maturation RNase YbeY [Bacteroidetes bacterium]|nr:rRNA maturation RNase YbeY [Bacteroidota bacterium]